MPATFSRLHNWATDEVITTAEINAEFNNILNNLDPSGVGDWSETAQQMQLTTSPGTPGNESLATALSGEIQRLRFMIQAILGSNATEWYSTPITDLTQIKNALGSTLATSKINSGPTSLYSSSLRFLTPGTSTPTVTVLGQTTSVIYAVNGSNYTISSNLVVGPLTLAPAATAIINDASQVGQESSKWQGEDNTTLSITNASAAITNLVGNYAAFQVASNSTAEYFLGYVSSANTLTNCLRGFFFNGTGSVTPMERIEVSNGNTISLCKLTWLYGNISAQVVVGYTPPTISNATPSSPSVGDYWYNLATQAWMTYNSSTWVTASATLLGICLQNTANTVAVRAFDAYSIALPYSNVILGYNSSTSVVAQNYGSKVGVGPNLIDFKNTRPLWISTSMDPNDTTAFSASTTYWSYVGEQGQLYFSYNKPYQSVSNGQGWYHPYENWRALGYIQTNSGTATFNSNSLVNYPLDVNNEAGQTGSSYNFLVNSAFDFWQAIGTASFVTASFATPTSVAAYGPDQWYIYNNIFNATAASASTASGIMQMTRQSGSLTGSYFAFKSAITGTPGGVPSQTAVGVEVGQVLSQGTNLNLLGQTASFGVWVKAVGNVNKLGITFMANTTVGKTYTSASGVTAIGTEAVFGINSTAYTFCAIKNQPLGTIPGTAGVFGIRLRATGVSSGNNYDSGNGFQLEQSQWNTGVATGSWQRQSQNMEHELQACQFFYETSYPQFPIGGTVYTPGTPCTTSYTAVPTFASVLPLGVSLSYKVSKNKVVFPFNTYSPTNAAGASGDFLNASNILVGGSITTPSISGAGLFSDYQANLFISNSQTNAVAIAFHWTADARI